MVLKLPDMKGRAPSVAISGTHDTRIGREVTSRRPDDTGLSGLRLVRHGRDAFAARYSLTRAAERYIDVQYYIWHDDLSGSLLLDELEAAAARGVRVRVLVDDIGIPRLDDRFACFAALDNVEVRIWNPCKIRKPKSINWLFDFPRLNHRMHSKSFTVDNQVTIVGGRNIGDEYFGARKDGLFADLDVLAVGPVVQQVSSAFDAYWNAPNAYPASAILKPVSESRRRRVTAKAQKLALSAKAQNYTALIHARHLFADITDGTVKLDWKPVTLVNHDYAGAAPPPPDELRLDDLLPAGLPTAESTLDIVSAYFVPTEGGAADLCELARKGVKVRILTNCYAATDVGFVHAGYAPYRERLLAAGVQLFEIPAPDDKPKSARKFVRTGSSGNRALRDNGRTLHAKTIAVDGRALYVGSANIDPRSARLNTEMGMIIHSEKFAAQISQMFATEIESGSYCLGLDYMERLYWVDARDEYPDREYTEPHMNWFARAVVALLGRLPIEPLL